MATIEIYSTRICPYCVAAKNLLKHKGAEWTEYLIDTDTEKRTEMLDRAKRTSVPQIFINDQHIGGFDDLKKLDQQGGLDPLLSA